MRWPTDWGSLRAIDSGPLDHFAALYDAIDDDVDPVIVELCRLRIARLLGADAHLRLRRSKATAAGLTETKIDELPRWAGSPFFSVAERDCLALTERFCMGAYTVTDDDVAAVLAHLGADGCYAFVNGIWVMEALMRMTVVLGIDPDPDALGLCSVDSTRTEVP